MRRYITLWLLFSFGTARAAELVSQASILTPGTFEIQSDQYGTSFANSTTGIPSIAVGLALPLANFNQFILSGQMTVGYRYKQGSYAVTSAEEVRPLESVSLHWIPFTLATKISYGIPGVTFVRPTLAFGLGAQWLRLVGDLPGYTRSFWTPFAFISPALTIVEAGGDTDWFGGFSFGPTLYQSFGSPQRISGMSLDLTLNILL